MAATSQILAAVILSAGCSFGAPPSTGGDWTTARDGRTTESEVRTETNRLAAVIPDADSKGVTLGPIAAGGEGSVLDAVGLHVDLIHPSTPDLALWLCYDADNDRQVDVRTEIEFHRASRDGWHGEVAFACASSLEGTYYFLEENGGDGPLGIFSGMWAGGSFYLVAADTLAEDVGVIRDWSVLVDYSGDAHGRTSQGGEVLSQMARTW